LVPIPDTRIPVSYEAVGRQSTLVQMPSRELLCVEHVRGGRQGANRNGCRRFPSKHAKTQFGSTIADLFHAIEMASDPSPSQILIRENVNRGVCRFGDPLNYVVWYVGPCRPIPE